MRASVQVKWWLDLAPSQQFEHTARRWPGSMTPPMTIQVRRLAPGMVGLVTLKGVRILKNGTPGVQDVEMQVALEDLRHTAPPAVKRAYLDVRNAVQAFNAAMDRFNADRSTSEDHPTGE